MIRISRPVSTEIRRVQAGPILWALAVFVGGMTFAEDTPVPETAEGGDSITLDFPIGGEVDCHNPENSTHLSWTSNVGSCTGVTQVVLATDPALTNVLVSIHPNAGGGNHYVHPGLPIGTYYWQVSEPCAGVSSEIGQFEVGSCDLEPRGDALRLDDGVASALSQPSIATNCGGEFTLVAWQAEGAVGTDSDGSSIRARWLVDGLPASAPDFQVNVFTDGNQSIPKVWVNEDGDFGVVWLSDDGTLRWRLYDGVTRIPGPETVGNLPEGAIDPHLAAGHGGRLGAVWRNDNLGFTAQLFELADGTPGAQAERAVLSHTHAWAGGPQIQVDDGGFVVVWGQADPVDGTPLENHIGNFQRFDSAGSPSGSQFEVWNITHDTSTYTNNTSRGFWGTAASAAGEFVVLSSTLSVGYDYDQVSRSLGARRFEREATEEASRAYIAGGSFAQARSAIADDGDFLVVWNESSGTKARHMPVGSDSGGTAVELSSQSAIGGAAVDMIEPADRGAVVAWVSEDCLDGASPCLLFSQLSHGEDLFSADFESGDLSDFCVVEGEPGE